MDISLEVIIREFNALEVMLVPVQSQWKVIVSFCKIKIKELFPK